MTQRISDIYKELYSGVKSKTYLAEKFKVTTKTIENTIAKTHNVIVYDRKLGGYRFSSLLPNYIPYDIIISLLQNSISNEIAKQDFATISRIIKNEKDAYIPMIPTSTLSSLSKKLIMLELAIKTNCIIKIDYQGNKKPLEEKYIKPHRINTSDNSYYLYASYDKKNINNIGEFRSFAVNSIYKINPIEWIKGEVFYIDIIGNAYGIIDKEKFVTLRLIKNAANYFKRERQFSKEQFDFVAEEIDGTVIMKMYYNNIEEVVRLVQQWMPYILVDDSSLEKQEIYKIINKHYRKLISNIGDDFYER